MLEQMDANAANNSITATGATWLCGKPVLHGSHHTLVFCRDSLARGILASVVARRFGNSFQGWPQNVCAVPASLFCMFCTSLHSLPAMCGAYHLPKVHAYHCPVCASSEHACDTGWRTWATTRWICLCWSRQGGSRRSSRRQCAWRGCWSTTWLSSSKLLMCAPCWTTRSAIPTEAFWDILQS
jgi:hypothetical protein